MSETTQMLKISLKSYEVLTDDEIDNFIQSFQVKKLDKFEFFIKEGEVCSEIAFIKTGIFRSFYISGKGEEVISCIKFPGSMMTAYSSFITGQNSFVNMQSITPSELLVVQKKVVDNLITSSPNWVMFFKLVAEQQYIELEKRTFQFQSETADQRYTLLLQQHPEYIHNIPLQYLASYLGITQRHLSRIRNSSHF